MPPDPHIRAALDAAHKARLENRRKRTVEALRRGGERMHGENGSADTAVAIAAFNRMMGASMRDANRILIAQLYEDLAAAVEAAARDE